MREGFKQWRNHWSSGVTIGDEGEKWMLRQETTLKIPFRLKDLRPWNTIVEVLNENSFSQHETSTPHQKTRKPTRMTYEWDQTTRGWVSYSLTSLDNRHHPLFVDLAIHRQVTYLMVIIAKRMDQIHHIEGFGNSSSPYQDRFNNV